MSKLFSPTNSRKIAEIHETDDYNAFRTIKGNRKVDASHVSKLMRSMKQRLLLTPIVVAKDGTIKDGQHRFEARKRLGLSIPYIVDIPDSDPILNDVQRFNSSSRNWSLTNFTESFVALGNENYIRLHLLLKEYSFQHSSLFTLIQNKKMVKSVHSDFKEGNFIFREEDYQRVRKLCERITDVGAFFDNYSDRLFVTACMFVMCTKGYNHRHMIKKAERFSNRLEKKSTVYDYFIMLVDIYNRYSQTQVAFNYPV